MDFGNFKLHIIRECHFRLDGGAMFGVVPKMLWNKLSPADEANRVLMACNLLLIETPTKKVLVETGMGPRWSQKERQRYALETLIDHEQALASVGLANDAVDAVIISHLHFDHIGGALIERGGKLVPTFPKARHYVQKGEWELAKKANARARGSYRPEDYQALAQHAMLEFIDGDADNVIPGISVRVTGGHTSHHQVVVFESAGKKGVYFADIIPTKNHLSPPWVMGYDHFPLHTCDVKDEWLTRAAAENWLVVFDHEQGVPWGSVCQTGDGKFAWQPLPEHTLDTSALQ